MPERSGDDMKKRVKGNLTSGKLVHKIPDVRSIVDQQMKRLDMTVYKLAKLTGISYQTLRNFLDGTHEMRSDKLGLVMDVLKLEIRPRR